MSKIGISELAAAVSTKYGISQESAEAFITSFFDVINDGLHTDKAVKVRGFGTFKVVDVRERESVNVNTGERVRIEGHGKVSYTPDPIMRDLVNKPFAKFETVVLNEGVKIDELNRVDDKEIGESVTDDAENDISASESGTQEDLEENDNEGGKSEKSNTVDVDSGEDELRAQVDTGDVSVADDTEAHVPEDPDGIETDNESSSIFPEEAATEYVDGILNKPDEICDEHATVEHAATEPTDELNDKQDSETTNGFNDDENVSFFCRNKIAIISVVMLLLIVISFAGGYLLGQSLASRPVYKAVKVYRFSTPKQVAADSMQQTDTVETDIQNNLKGASKQEATVKTAKDVNGSKVITNDSETKRLSSSDIKELDNARRHAETGAYIITGTASTITIGRGQTMSSISRQYLGEGMECYVQIHNNVVSVREGMKLKIPQLKLKKR